MNSACSLGVAVPFMILSVIVSSIAEAKVAVAILSWDGDVSGAVNG